MAPTSSASQVSLENEVASYREQLDGCVVYTKGLQRNFEAMSLLCKYAQDFLKRKPNQASSKLLINLFRKS